MSNVQPGDIAFYVGPEHRNGPRYMQFCKVLGPVRSEYRLIGCCGNHTIVGMAKADGAVWTVEWSNPIQVGLAAGGPLTIVEAPEWDKYLRKLDGKITDADIVADGVEIREAEQMVTDLKAKLAVLKWQGYVFDEPAILTGLRRQIANQWRPAQVALVMRGQQFGRWARARRFIVHAARRAWRALRAARPADPAAPARREPSLTNYQRTST